MFAIKTNLRAMLSLIVKYPLSFLSEALMIVVGLFPLFLVLHLIPQFVLPQDMAARVFNDFWTLSGGAPYLLGFVILGFWYRKTVHYLDLESRKTVATPGTWQILMNNVAVGTISDAAYAMLRQAAICKSEVIHTREIAILLGIFKRCLARFLIETPALLFWVSIAAWLVAPELVKQTYAALTASENTDQVQQIVTTALQYLLGFTPAIYCTAYLAINLPSPIGCAEEEVSRRICTYARIPYQGKVVLVRHKTNSAATCEGDPMNTFDWEYNDEGTRLRKLIVGKA